jgi:D-alanyl-D-alanine carboxypeptidase (penicillin-binding protein 5/6)
VRNAPLAPAAHTAHRPGRHVGGDPAAALGITAAAAILVDGRSGQAVFADNADEPRPPASLTKILTALVILDRAQPSEIVTVSAHAARTAGYRLGLRAGQRLSLEDLVAAILIRSANDAAVAAAEHVGGSIAGFAGLMNAKARALGMAHSQFVNPHGLDAPGHVTTARDMARLTQVALEDPRFARVVSARHTTVTIWPPGSPRRILSHNRLLGRLPGADGVKTGYTGKAGRCLVASATRGEQQLIAVLFNAPNRWHDATVLLEYGFRRAPPGVPSASPTPEPGMDVTKAREEGGGASAEAGLGRGEHRRDEDTGEGDARG